MNCVLRSLTSENVGDEVTSPGGGHPRCIHDKKNPWGIGLAYLAWPSRLCSVRAGPVWVLEKPENSSAIQTILALKTYQPSAIQTFESEPSKSPAIQTDTGRLLTVPFHHLVKTS